ncbi:MAG: DUF1801 domain-containing protein [Candidatus Bathyarchaeia archaeon]|jgi:hypothetical protein
MGNNEKRTLDQVYSSLNEKQRQTTMNLQNLIKNVIPEATEILRHGNITYILNDRDLVWLTQASGHVDVEFANGASLASMLLTSHGTKEKNSCIRHVEVTSFEKYQREIERLLKDAKRLALESYPQTPA